MAAEQRDTAGVIAPPPLIFGAAVLLGLVLNRGRPLPALPSAIGRPLGALLALAGCGLGAAAVAALRRGGTTVSPYEQTSVVVDRGPYARSRNPIYLGMALLTAGIGLWTSAGWVLLFLPAALAAVQKGVVEREEAYLTRWFPVAYPAYAARVRRWL